jgi:hypothetical protein
MSVAMGVAGFVAELGEDLATMRAEREERRRREVPKQEITGPVMLPPMLHVFIFIVAFGLLATVPPLGLIVLAIYLIHLMGARRFFQVITCILILLILVAVALAVHGH